MKMMYISHPFTGNEAMNRIDATRVKKTLQLTYPNICFVTTDAKRTAVRAVTSVVSGGRMSAIMRPEDAELKSKYSPFPPRPAMCAKSMSDKVNVTMQKIMSIIARSP